MEPIQQIVPFNIAVEPVIKSAIIESNLEFQNLIKVAQENQQISNDKIAQVRNQLAALRSQSKEFNSRRQEKAKDLKERGFIKHQAAINVISVNVSKAKMDTARLKEWLEEHQHHYCSTVQNVVT